MEYAVQNAAPQPTLQHIVREVDGRRARVIVFSGVVTVAPAPPPRIVVRTTPQQPGAPVGFYVPDGFGIPLEEAVAVGEASLTQVVVAGRKQVATTYGVADTKVRLVESEHTPGLGWPYVTFTCHSNDLGLGVHYRVTVQHPLALNPQSQQASPPQSVVLRLLRQR